jgi:hypothetical protein
MSTATVSTEPIAVRAWVSGRMIHLELSDQRQFAFPASRFSRLRDASNADLESVKIEVNGFALRWDSLDEDISVPGVVAGHFELPPS